MNVAELVAASRADQGLAERIIDPAALARIAALIASDGKPIGAGDE